jgi:hypothetical protein
MNWKSCSSYKTNINFKGTGRKKYGTPKATEVIQIGKIGTFYVIKTVTKYFEGIILMSTVLFFENYAAEN